MGNKPTKNFSLKKPQENTLNTDEPIIEENHYKDYGMSKENTLTKNDKIGRKKLKSIFKELCKENEELPLSDAVNYYDYILYSFKFSKTIQIIKYEDEERALDDYFYYQIHKAKPIEKKLTEYIKERLGNKKNLSYYQFEMGFLLLFNNQTELVYNKGYEDLEKKYENEFSKKLEFRQLTLREDDIFKRKIIEKKENIQPTEGEQKEMKAEVSFSENFRLPEQKGLRLTIFTMIFQYLDALETLKCGLVCKEWLAISRNDKLWKIHIQNDFQKDIEDKYSYKVTFQDYQLIVDYLKNINQEENNTIHGKTPLFLKYWKYADGILEIRGKNSKPQMLYLECGINAVPRTQISNNEEECLKGDFALESTSNTPESCQKPEINIPNNRRVVTMNEEGEEVGCCHDSVKEIAQSSFFSRNSFSFLSTLKMEGNLEEIEVWKKSICRKVSLECMENEMSHQQIRERLFDLISQKFFDL
eukprot:TRINITY_DN1409_c0_g1_i5.p1 TRINITY_DN1409_c0_g1~~TRINITY_DN1409_c0_g1_i5.p1  ORF type:complete len:473 (-),score=140.38 TRINITY_DN1409_c0_g1_i5:77-1495(-)